MFRKTSCVSTAACPRQDPKGYVESVWAWATAMQFARRRPLEGKRDIAGVTRIAIKREWSSLWCLRWRWETHKSNNSRDKQVFPFSSLHLIASWAWSRSHSQSICSAIWPLPHLPSWHHSSPLLLQTWLSPLPRPLKPVASKFIPVQKNRTPAVTYPDTDPLCSSGIGTIYLQGGAAGSCGAVNPDSAMVAALSPSFMSGGSSNCGRKIKITNTGSNDGVGGSGNAITVTVADTCPSCDQGHLDLSEGAWNALTGNAAYGTVNISWWVDSLSRLSTLWVGREPEADLLLIGISREESHDRLMSWWMHVLAFFFVFFKRKKMNSGGNLLVEGPPSSDSRRVGRGRVTDTHHEYWMTWEK